jgi:hypothetical protein
MANRPNRNSRNTSIPKKKTQSEINRTKPVGVLSLNLLKEKSKRIQTINVQLPDKDILEFYHLPMSVAQAEEFFDLIRSENSTLSDTILAKKNMLNDQLVNKDGSKFVDENLSDEERLAVWDPIDIQAVNAIVDAILESPRSEAGED